MGNKAMSGGNHPSAGRSSSEDFSRASTRALSVEQWPRTSYNRKHEANHEEVANSVHQSRCGPRKRHGKATSKNVTSNNKSSDLEIQGGVVVGFATAYRAFSTALKIPEKQGRDNLNLHVLFLGALRLALDKENAQHTHAVANPKTWVVKFTPQISGVNLEKSLLLQCFFRHGPEI